MKLETETMTDLILRARRRASIVLCGAALLAVGVSGCATTGEPQRVDLGQDYRTCSDFGAAPGSSAYTDCMVAQQRRRDTAERDAIEKNALINQSARDAYEAAELARRGRCQRDPDRRECGQ